MWFSMDLAKSNMIDPCALTPVAAATPPLPNWERELGGEGQLNLVILDA